MIRSHPHFSRSLHALLASLVMNVNLSRPYYVNISNFQSTLVHVPKHHFIWIVEPDFATETPITDLNQEILTIITASSDDNLPDTNAEPKHRTNTVKIGAQCKD